MNKFNQSAQQASYRPSHSIVPCLCRSIMCWHTTTSI